ncbi:MAG: ABC transporter substrate-binding protein [Sporichthyaceae bacterium]
MPLRPRRARVGLASTALALLLAGCGQAGLQAVDRGERPFVAAIGGQPDQLDPHKTTAHASFQILENVYDTLVVPDATGGAFSPQLAESWTMAEDGRSWTFTLRQGVKFADGSEFDAADVVYSIERIVDGKLSNAYRLEPIAEVVAVDPHTVRFELKRPTPYLLSQLGGFKGTAILPQGAAERLNLARETVGTGPFRVVRDTAAGVTLLPNEHYWGEPVEVSSVEFRYVSEPTTALVALQTGQIDWTDNLPPARVRKLAEDDDVRLGQIPSVDYWYLGPNFQRGPFDDPKVRQAINLGLDREAIAEAAQPGLAKPIQTAIPEGVYGHSDYAPASRDVPRARRLLAEAGQPRFTMGLMVTGEYPETVQAAQVIASNLHEIGIDVRVEVEEFATWLDRQGKGEFDTFLLGWLGNADPFDFYQSQHACDGSNNYQGYCDERTDALLEQAAAQADPTRRAQLYDEAARRIVDAGSYIYLYNPQVVHGWSPKLTGYQVRADRAVNFENVELAP